MSAQYDRAKENSEKMRQLTNKLMSDINEAESKLKELSAKLTVAKQQEQEVRTEQKTGRDPLGYFDNLLESVQKRVDQPEAAVQLNKELAGESASMAGLAAKYEAEAQKSKPCSIEEQLAMMKANVSQN